MREFIKKIGLSTIKNYNYYSTLQGGQASTSLVYIHKKTNEKIVAKFLIAPRNDLEYERFKNEAETLREVRHIQQSLQKSSSVPKLKVDFTQHESLPIYYFAMEFIEGITLEMYLKENPIPWHWKESTTFIFRLSVSLSYINSHYVHRDLHPKNIMVVGNGNFDKKTHTYKDTGIKILDFGCSINKLKELYEDILDDNYRLPGAISSWSPELLLNPAHVEFKHDTWALGVMYYRMLTGKYPFRINSLGDVMNAFAKSSLDFSTIDELKCPSAVKYLVKNLLSFDQKLRFGVGVIADACNDILNSNLTRMDEELIQQYFDQGASLVQCLRCGTSVSINWERCHNCGHPVNDEEVYDLIEYE